MARSAKVKSAMREIQEKIRNYRRPGRLKVKARSTRLKGGPLSGEKVVLERGDMCPVL